MRNTSAVLALVAADGPSARWTDMQQAQPVAVPLLSARRALALTAVYS